MKRRYKPIGDTLKKVLKDSNLQALVESKEFEKKWNKWDPKITRHVSFVRYDLESGLIVMQVDDPVWKKEFLENSDIILTRIKNEFRSFKISGLRIV